MKIFRSVVWSWALFAVTTWVEAQKTNDIEALKKQLKEATEKFEKSAQEQRQIIDSLNKRLEAIEKQQAGAAEKDKLAKELAAEMQTNAAGSNATAAAAIAPATT